MPRCKFLFVADLGDPISCISLNDIGCMAGTMLGKVWLHNFDTKQVEMLTAFSDEGIRGLYLDEDSGYATIMESCRSWRRANPNQYIPPLNFRNLDKKNTQSVKHVLQRGPWACVLFPITSTVVNVARQEHHLRQFRLFDFGSPAEVAPVDFDGTHLVIVDRSHTARSPLYHLIHLEKNENIEVSDLPKSSSVTLMKLWGPDCLVYAVGGNSVYVYDYSKKQTRFELSGHRAEIAAIDAQDEITIATLSLDAEVRLWNGTTGECTQSLFVPEASYFIGFPYFLSVRGRRVLVSADEGVYLLEFDAAAVEP